MRYFTSLLALGTILAGTAQAAPLVLQNKNNNLALSIYNQNLALVKDTRSADLKSGENEVIFDGVAQHIQPETAIIYGRNIKVLEQNYSYNLMTNNNLIDQSVGQEVTTVRENPKNGENIFERATIIGSIYGQPVLKFSYGIESNFPGRIVFDKIPAGVSNKPALTAKLNSKKAGSQNLYLAYLTEGLSWKTDYVANVTGLGRLDLTGWVTITNESGIDYKDAKIQLIAGDVNTVRNAVRPLMRKTFAVMESAAMEDGAVAGGIPETINSYELYTLPNITSIKDKQNKQIGLIEKNSVVFTKEFNFNSPLYFGGQNEFEKKHPSITYVIENTAAANLGISLPAGTVRFYENDKNGNLQFIGAGQIGNTAKEDTLKLNLGEAFNISLKGKITQSAEKELQREPVNTCFNVKTLKTYEVKMTVNNAEETDNSVIISQYFPDNFKITKENIKSSSKNANTRQWTIKVPAGSKGTLTYTVEITRTNRLCN